MALSSAGFDDVLSAVGTHFGFKGLACYQVTFIAVSVSNRGFIHHDFTGTAKEHNASRAFNIIIPLILADETGPELDLQSDDAKFIGRLRYQYDVAAMVSRGAVSLQLP